MVFLTDVLTLEKITTFLHQFQQYERPRLDRYASYYNGKQDILNKVVNDKTKPCNKIVTNFCYNIVGNYQGYLTGNDVTYTSPKDISAIVDVLSYNDVRTEDNELLKQALIFGRAFEVNYIDEDGQQRFKVLDARECVPVYQNTLNQDLLCVIRYWPIDIFDLTKGFNVDIYYSDHIEHYNMGATYSTLQFIGDEPHFYRQVPVTVFELNQENASIFDKVMTLQDAYNTLLSSEVDDFQSFCDAYMVIKGVNLEQEEAQQMKEKRTMVLGSPDASVEYLNKQISDTQIENMLTNIEKQIHTISNSPDFTDDAFGTASGVAMKYKLLGFENTAGAIVANMTKALQKRIELICEILGMVEGESMWRDVEITFTRNLPVDLTELSGLVTSLHGMVSDKTLLALLPFVSDVDKELEQLNDQKTSNMELFAMNTTPVSGEEQEEDDEV